MRFPCPIHGGRELSAVAEVKDNTLVFVCFSGCGAEGSDALGLIAAIRGLDVRTQFREVLEEAASVAGVSIDSLPLAPRTRAFTPEIAPEVVEARREAAEGVRRVVGALLDLCPLTGEGLRYLTEERGLTRRTCEDARIGFVGDPDRVLRVLSATFPAEALDVAGIVYDGGYLAHARHPLLFPIVRGGVAVYVQGRALGPVAKKPDRWRSMRGGVPGLYNADALERADVPVMLCEGPIDTLSAAQWVPDVAPVGVFGAGGFKDEWAAPMRGREVWVAFDPDAAGDKGSATTMRTLVAAGAWPKRVAMPSGMDVNEWYLAEMA